jgi:hypothetical protein
MGRKLSPIAVAKRSASTASTTPPTRCSTSAGRTGSRTDSVEHRQEKSWWRRVARIELEHFDSSEEMAAVEVRYIAELHPVFNVVSRVVEPENDPIPIFWANDTPERANNVPEPYLRPEEVCEGLGWAIWDLQAAVKGGCPSVRIGARHRRRLPRRARHARRRQRPDVHHQPALLRLRDYGHDGQIGLEETPEQYVANARSGVPRSAAGAARRRDALAEPGGATRMYAVEREAQQGRLGRRPPRRDQRVRAVRLRVRGRQGTSLLLRVLRW